MKTTDFPINTTVRALRAFFDVPDKSTGVVVDHYAIGSHKGITIKWDHNGIEDGFGQDELHYLEIINER